MLCCPGPRQVWLLLLDPLHRRCPDNNVLSSVAGSADRGCGEGSLAAEKVADQPPVASILGELQPITASSTV